MTPASEDDSPLILLADDDRSMRSLLRLAMEEEGYTIAEAKNGEQCLAEFKRLQPDMVLLDAVMPVLDGFTCCSQLRSLPGGEHTPVLMITVLDDADSVDRAFEAGATDYVTKPLHWAVLRQRVSRLLQASQSLQQITEVSQILEQVGLREQLFRFIAQSLSESLPQTEIISGSLLQLRHFLGVDRVALYDRQGTCHRESVATPALTIAPSSLQQTPYYLRLRSAEVVALSDIQITESEEVTAYFAPLNVNAALWVPFPANAEWQGVLGVYHSQGRSWNSAEIEFLSQFCTLLNHVIPALNSDGKSPPRS
jgi:DNA-binding response OmpR family regulator